MGGVVVVGAGSREEEEDEFREGSGRREWEDAGERLAMDEDEEGERDMGGDVIPRGEEER